jgi:HD-GYP domain-containing protein (c-di-GMP phosphodiesterase class II)
MSTLARSAVETERRSYVPVPMDVFTPGCPLEFSLYAKAASRALSLVCRAGDALAEKDLDGWRKAGMRVLYVDTAEHRLYQRYAESVMDDLVERDDLPTARKAELCYQTTRELIREAVQTSHPDAMIGERREKWVNNLVSLICADEAAVSGMLSMLSHDYYTYTHMVNVSVMVTSLAFGLGERDPEKLRALASGGLLHDVGKLRINPETLNKLGRLTPQEWDELRSHPGLGLEVLHGRPDITPPELKMVHQHHEKLDGSGYPLGLLGSEITPEAQMTAVVDIYDALTCKRPYRPAMTHQKAAAILHEEAQAKINGQMVGAWLATIEQALAAEE